MPREVQDAREEGKAALHYRHRSHLHVVLFEFETFGKRRGEVLKIEGCVVRYFFSRPFDAKWVTAACALAVGTVHVYKNFYLK